LDLNTVSQGLRQKLAKFENQPQIKSLGSNLNMFDMKTQTNFDSILQRTLYTMNFILTKFELLKQIHLYKFTKTLIDINDIFHATPLTQHMQH
jgi:hypothetical protein